MDIHRLSVYVCEYGFPIINNKQLKKNFCLFFLRPQEICWEMFADKSGVTIKKTFHYFNQLDH